MIQANEDLFVFGTYDRGVPNQERIVLHANCPTSLERYALLLGVPGLNNSIHPLRDSFLWLGRTVLDARSWVFVFTGNGDPIVTKETHTGEPIHTIFWQKPYVVLQDPAILPVLLHFDRLHWTDKNFSIAELIKTTHDQLAIDEFYKALLPPDDKKPK